MPYRFPINVGDRVALAPHLDLWMAGVRFGTVREAMFNEENQRRYLIECGPGKSFWAENSDLLGAVSIQGRVMVNPDSIGAGYPEEGQ